MTSKLDLNILGEVLETDRERYPLHFHILTAHDFNTLLAEIRSLSARPHEVSPLTALMLQFRMSLVEDPGKRSALESICERANLLSSVVVTEAQLENRKSNSYALVATRCTMCGQSLKDALSVSRGIGPVCWRKSFEESEESKSLTPAVREQIRLLLLIGADTRTSIDERLFLAERIEMLGGKTIADRIRKRSKKRLRELEEENKPWSEKLGAVSWRGLGSNRNGQKCVCCGEWVGSEEGFLGKSEKRGWIVCCQSDKCKEQIGREDTSSARRESSSRVVAPRVTLYQRRNMRLVTVSLVPRNNTAFDDQRQAVRAAGLRWDRQTSSWVSDLSSQADTRLLLEQLEELGIDHGIDLDLELPETVVPEPPSVRVIDAGLKTTLVVKLDPKHDDFDLDTEVMNTFEGMRTTVDDRGFVIHSIAKTGREGGAEIEELAHLVRLLILDE